jgi:hypothetical protein
LRKLGTRGAGDSGSGALASLRASSRPRASRLVATAREANEPRTSNAAMADYAREDDNSALFTSSERHEIANENDGNLAARPHRDVAFKRAFATSLAVTILCGLLALSRVSADAHVLTEAETLNKYESCHAANGVGARRRTLLEDGADEDAATALTKARPYVVMAMLGACAMGALALTAFKRHPRFATWSMIYVKIGSCFALSIAFAIERMAFPCILFALFAAFFAYWMHATRDRVELVAKLLGAASTALKDNPHLITTSVFAGLAVIVSSIMFFTCVWGAYMNGSIAPSDYETYRGGKCYYGEEVVPCCEWQTDGWVGPYVVFALLVWLWSHMIAAEMRTFVIGGSISRWYFAPAGTTAFVGTTREFIGHAFGASFGSLAFGGLVLTGVTILRNLNERLRRESRGFMAILACIVTAVMDCIAEIIETITKFATIQCAITGESLLESGREVTRLLKDNFLSALRVWWLPEMILNMTALFFAIFYGVVVGISVHVGVQVSTGDDDLAHNVGAIVGACAGVSSIVILSFLFSVLLTCIDAVFICYARDKDENMITKPEIVAIYDEVTEKTRAPDVAVAAAQRAQRPPPTARSDPGVVFQTPNAPMMYGRPDGNSLV